MPFLPTLAVVAILGVASVYCPSSKPAQTAPGAGLAQTDPLTTQSLAPAPISAAPSPTAFARTAPTAAPSGRLPASLAFAEAYPLDGSAPKTVVPAPHVGTPSRLTPRLAVANRRACPGRRCPAAAPRGADPLAAAHAEAAEPVGDDSVAQTALPFAETVAESLVPAARIVGEAAELVRGSAATVQGAVSLAVTDCLR